jgi:PBP1b-binding outer membrane lipoprotein LpoB
MQMRKIIYIVALGMTALFLTGCATEPSRVEMDYGTSYKLAKYNQTLNPDAEKNLEPVTGIDGQVGEKIIEKYNKGFEKPAQAMPTLTLGGMISGAGGK